MNKTDREQIIKLSTGFGELKGKVDQMDKNLTTNFEGLERRVVEMHNSVKVVIKDHDDRINVVEEDCAQMKGKSAGIAFVVSLIISILALIAAYLAFFAK